MWVTSGLGPGPHCLCGQLAGGGSMMMEPDSGQEGRWLLTASGCKVQLLGASAQVALVARQQPPSVAHAARVDAS